MSAWTIVVAAGTGTRFGGTKQLEVLEGKSVLHRAVETAAAATAGVVAVVPSELVEEMQSLPGVTTAVAGGRTRSESVRNGLGAVPLNIDVVLVHDAARPLATKTLFERIIEEVEAGADGAIPGIEVTDTIKRVKRSSNYKAGVVVSTLDRSELIAVQTPQGFRSETLRRAHKNGSTATDDAALVEAIGGKVVVVPGEQDNIKITRREDVPRLTTILKGRTK